MSSTETRSTKELFRAWRAGDADAGQVMAQRFADWYYAIATSRLGEDRGRKPTEAACAAFGAGIVNVSESRQLVTWAHQLIAQEMVKAGQRAMDGDDASSYTGGQRPKQLLVKARRHLSREVDLLEACYGGKKDEAEIDKLATDLGGWPLGVLKARYRVKQWLRDNSSVPFEVAPDAPNLDRAPLPLYEANRMSDPTEEVEFEHWMLTDLDLCKDIAEFAHFSIALRGGLANATSAPAKPTVPQGTDAPGGPGKAAIGIVAVIVIGLVVIGGLGAAGVALFFVMGS